MSGPFAALNGKRITSASVTIPYYGAWCADVVLAQPDAIATVSTLVLGDLTLTGSIFRVASFSGALSARIVGGYGGWRKTVPAQAYQNTRGVKMSVVLGDAAAAVGEQISIAQDVVVGTSYVREAAPAERLLRQLAGQVWWIDNKGVTQIGPRLTSQITSQFTVVGWSGGKGTFEIATEAVSDWLPNRTFSSATVSKVQTVGLTSIVVDNEGKLRINVLSAGAGAQ